MEHGRSLFDRDWRLLDVTCKYPSAGDQPKPAMLTEMIAIAETLGREFPLVRIDLYEHQNHVYFGEITHTPGGGFEGFDPPEFDRALGELISTGGDVGRTLNKFLPTL